MERDLTVVEHLEELRARALIALGSLGLATAFSVPFSAKLLKVLMLPAAGLIEKLAFFGPEEAFVIYMKVSFLAGLLISFPVVAGQVWGFISPAVAGRFKRQGAFLVTACSAAFASGALFAYFLLLPRALNFLLRFGEGQLEPVISAARYISFAVFLIAGCGLIFEMPVVSFLLTRAGLLSARALRRYFKYAVIVIFIVAAVVTPTPDAFNMVVVALPMLVLYEVSVWVSFLAGLKKRRA